MLDVASGKPNFCVNGVDKLGGPLTLLKDTLEAMQSADIDKAGEHGG